MTFPSGPAALGVWSTLPDPVTAELLGRVGYDYLCVDLQHGMTGPGTVVPVLQALRHTPATTLVRVADHRPDAMMRALDLGADGVIVPMVDSPEQAAAAVAACTYPPAGFRSWGPMWGDVDGTAPAPERADADRLVFVMVETAAGFEAVREIAAVPGLAGIYVGPNDLALTLGLGRETYAGSAAVHRALDTVLAATEAAGIVMGLHCATGQMAAYWRERGVRMLTVATDSTLLRTASADVLATARGEA
ncbi:HpcH/HpaI aldolase family protein [Cellulomonas denverensis]|uniref:HpcH/HpaI aldolase family protein n=1 Tax=Cellulomonas denverensis TaxID=264297 RepID=UPI0035E9A95E